MKENNKQLGYKYVWSGEDDWWRRGHTTWKLEIRSPDNTIGIKADEFYAFCGVSDYHKYKDGILPATAEFAGSHFSPLLAAIRLLEDAHNNDLVFTIRATCQEPDVSVEEYKAKLLRFNFSVDRMQMPRPCEHGYNIELRCVIDNDGGAE